MTAAERIFAEALALPADERIALAERLLALTPVGEENEKLKVLRSAVAAGLEELDAGRGVNTSSVELITHLKARRE